MAIGLNWPTGARGTLLPRRNNEECIMWQIRASRGVLLLAIAAAWFVGDIVFGQDYRIERIASGLNQPTYLTQAPGDPANILYFSERTSNTIGGFGAVNQKGEKWKKKTTTRPRTLVLDLSSRLITNDDGLETFAFHPDFNTSGALGFHKLYVTSAQFPNPGNALDRVEEYTVGAGGTATLTRTILQYTNNTQNNHTVDWV